MPGTLSILLNIGKFIRLGKDIEAAVQHLIAGKLSEDDGKKLLEDIKALLGLFSIPNVSQAQIEQLISEIQAAI